MNTWRCNECKSEFQFRPITAVNGDVKRKHPEFCPYCGRESNHFADDKTYFTSVGVVSDLKEGM